MAGSSALRDAGSSPTASSRLISIPTTKKKTRHQPVVDDLAQAGLDLRAPEAQRDRVVHRARNSALQGEFASPNARRAAPNRAMPPEASIRVNARRGSRTMDWKSGGGRRWAGSGIGRRTLKPPGPPRTPDGGRGTDVGLGFLGSQRRSVGLVVRTDQPN